jgi:Coenzyme PQQ synthesis protein D (PqqD)
VTAIDQSKDVAPKLRRSQGVVWRRTMDGVVVLPARSVEPIALLGPAANMWEMLAEPLTAAELVAALADHYGVEPDRVTNEIRATLDGLLRRGALCRH